MSIIDTLPIFVMIYDKAKVAIKHVNKHFKKIFFPTLYQPEMLSSLVDFKQRIKILHRGTPNEVREHHIKEDK
jgi:hypothetical protein